MSISPRALLRSSLGLCGLLMVLSGSVAEVAGEPDNRAVNWLSYREAMDAGRDQGKPILLHFTSSYSEICRRMKRVTYRDRKVIRRLNASFAVALVDIERLPALARKYKVESLPVLWFLDASGKPLTSIAGEVGPEKLMRVTEYIDRKIYEHTDYNTWLDKRSTR